MQRTLPSLWCHTHAHLHCLKLAQCKQRQRSREFLTFAIVALLGQIDEAMRLIDQWSGVVRSGVEWSGGGGRGRTPSKGGREDDVPRTKSPEKARPRSHASGGRGGYTRRRKGPLLGQGIRLAAHLHILAPIDSASDLDIVTGSEHMCLGSP